MEHRAYIRFNDFLYEGLKRIYFPVKPQLIAFSAIDHKQRSAKL